MAFDASFPTQSAEILYFAVSVIRIAVLSTVEVFAVTREFKPYPVKNLFCVIYVNYSSFGNNLFTTLTGNNSFSTVWEVNYLFVCVELI